VALASRILKRSWRPTGFLLIIPWPAAAILCWWQPRCLSRRAAGETVAFRDLHRRVAPGAAALWPWAGPAPCAFCGACSWPWAATPSAPWRWCSSSTS